MIREFMNTMVACLRQGFLPGFPRAESSPADFPHLPRTSDCASFHANHTAMSRTLVKDALHATAPLDSILLQGWVRTRRDAKAFSFIEVNDGSCLKGIQVIADAGLPDYATEIAKALTGQDAFR